MSFTCVCLARFGGWHATLPCNTEFICVARRLNFRRGGRLYAKQSFFAASARPQAIFLFLPLPSPLCYRGSIKMAVRWWRTSQPAFKRLLSGRCMAGTCQLLCCCASRRPSPGRSFCVTGCAFCFHEEWCSFSAGYLLLQAPPFETLAQRTLAKTNPGVPTSLLGSKLQARSLLYVTVSVDQSSHISLLSGGLLPSK